MSKIINHKLCQQYQSEIKDYFSDGAKKLNGVADKVIRKLGFYDIDISEYYSLAGEVFLFSLNDYDSSEPFDSFIYSCLYKKFCSYMTETKRYKRCNIVKIKKINENGDVVIEKKEVKDISIDAPLDDENESITIGNMIPDKNSTIESQIFGECENSEEWRKEVRDYLDSLSPLQKKIALLISKNYTPDEICEELHITMNHLQNSIKRMSADNKIKILRPLVERM